MRLVADTNVVASAFLWGGIPGQILQAARENQIALFTSVPLLAELVDILSRSKFEQKISASALSVEELVELYAVLAKPVVPAPIPRISRDPDDDTVIATAVAANADIVVSGDKDLLTLTSYESILILNPAETLRSIQYSPQHN